MRATVPTREARVAAADLEAALDQDDAEAAVAAQARLGQRAVARLEHVERQHRVREQHRAEREHRHRLPRHPHHATGAQAVTFVDRAATGRSDADGERGGVARRRTSRDRRELQVVAVAEHVVGVERGAREVGHARAVAVGGEHRVAHVLGQGEL